MKSAGDDADLWEEYQSVLSGHIHPGHDAVDTINRLLRKSPWLTAAGTMFQIPRTGLEISQKSWELSQLWPLIHSDQITAQEPASLNGAVLLLRWADVNYLIDGRRRVNSWRRHGIPGPHRTLVVQRVK
jgi:hypothetical protein